MKGYAENLKDDAEKIYVRDNGGYTFQNMELYFMKDKDNFMTTRCSVSQYGISWDNPMAMMLVGIIQDMLTSSPRTLGEDASEFMSLQSLIDKEQ